MTGQRPNWYWMACWKYISPLAMLIILLASLAKMLTGTTYEAWDSTLGENVNREWPGWCKFLSASLILSPTLWIPGVAVAKYFRLYNWTRSEPAFFPREKLQAELDSSMEYTRPFESKWKTAWERKLFYWMPFCGLTNEIEDDEPIKVETKETSSIVTGEESPC